MLISVTSLAPPVPCVSDSCGAGHGFEMHSLPGGLCTAWKPKGYTVDGCVRWLVGSSPRSGFPGSSSQVEMVNVATPENADASSVFVGPPNPCGVSELEKGAENENLLRPAWRKPGQSAARDL